ncbi:MAG: hypothetical protein DCC75_02680 [Proteobacteria bacterium]|nr:MAG: hypothetical protein DCC75_02680 [Pseudomonadota bacterium]
MGRKKKTLSDTVETEVLQTEHSVADEANADAAETKSLSSQVEKTRTRQKSYLMDLRIHSPASLGYLGIEGLDTAPALVRLARVKGLDVIAVTDFYTGTFIDRVMAAAKDSNLTVIPGTVIRCAIPGCSDVVLSCLFPEQHSGDHIEKFLGALGVPKNAAGNRSYLVQRQLREIVTIIEQFNGVALPSRMDKTPSRLSAIPSLVETYGFRAFDLAYPDSARFFKTRWPKIKFQLFSFSNANALAQVGSRVANVRMPLGGFEGIRQLIARQAVSGQTSL